jgi:branched-chain amino acid transport system ATP-binding protein
MGGIMNGLYLVGDTQPALKLDGVTAGYGDHIVLRDVSLEVRPGSVVALLGPNGAGKTTLMRTASGLLRPQDGTVSVGGTDVSRMRPYQFVKRGVCHVPEGRGIFPSLTVRENLRMFATATDDPDSIDRAFVAFPALAERSNQAAGTLSGGQQQMLALARAWMHRPSLVLIDEPTLGLAPLVVGAVYEFLQQLAQLGAAMVIVEQYVEKVLAIADDVHVLVNGRFVYSGRAADADRDALAAHYVGAVAAAEAARDVSDAYEQVSCVDPVGS